MASYRESIKVTCLRKSNLIMSTQVGNDNWLGPTLQKARLCYNRQIVDYLFTVHILSLSGMNHRVENIIIKVAISPFVIMLLKCVCCICVEMHLHMGKGQIIYGETVQLTYFFSPQMNHAIHKWHLGFCNQPIFISIWSRSSMFTI